jgi:nitrogen fixation protein NifU and related proteins
MSKDIYREELMDIYKNPPHKGKIDKPTVASEKNNPMCGDEIHLQLQINNGIVEDAKFDGSACAVSVISASMLTDMIIGKSIVELQKLTKEELLNTLDLNLTTSRVKCATLAFNALRDILDIYEPVTKK